MQPTDFDSIPPSSPTAAPLGEPGDSLAVTGPARRWMLTLVAGAVAGFLAWLGGEASLDRIKPPRHAVNSKGLVLNLTNRHEIAIADAKNAGLAFAILGASLGVGLGVAGGLVRRSGRAAMSAALVGLVVGTAGTATISLALLPAYNNYKTQHPDEAARDLILPLLIHAGIWSVVGASGGVAYGVGQGSWRSLPPIVLGGLAGAAIGTMAFELIGAAAFPAAQTTQFVSATWLTRLFARLCVTLLAAGGVALAAGGPRNQAG
jgi:hypothetical protein